MKALTIVPGQKGSTRLDDVREPVSGGAVLVDIVAVGVCGTDRDLVDGKYGAPPPGESRLIIGHEALARVREAPTDSNLALGDWVVPIVRMPDPVPCENCAAGEWDMCRNGQYTEHGIKGLHGFATARARLPGGARFLVPIDARLGAEGTGVLVEPTSVVAKAWDHIERIGKRSLWRPRRVLITGAGPVGLLAGLLSKQRGLAVTLLDRNATGPKPELARKLGADYATRDATGAASEADVIIECTGAAPVILDVIAAARPNAIVCLLGLSPAGRGVVVDMASINQSLVLENNVVFGSVNANRAHYEMAARALQAADPAWLRALITRRHPLAEWATALEKHKDDVKVVLEPG